MDQPPLPKTDQASAGKEATKTPTGRRSIWCNFISWGLTAVLTVGTVAFAANTFLKESEHSAGPSALFLGFLVFGTGVCWINVSKTFQNANLGGMNVGHALHEIGMALIVGFVVLVIIEIAIHTKHHAQLTKELAVRKKLIRVGNSLTRLDTRPSQELEKDLDASERILEDLGELAFLNDASDRIRFQLASTLTGENKHEKAKSHYEKLMVRTDDPEKKDQLTMSIAAAEAELNKYLDAAERVQKAYEARKRTNVARGDSVLAQYYELSRKYSGLLATSRMAEFEAKKRLGPPEKIDLAQHTEINWSKKVKLDSAIAFRMLVFSFPNNYEYKVTISRNGGNMDRTKCLAIAKSATTGNVKSAIWPRDTRYTPFADHILLVPEDRDR